MIATAAYAASAHLAIGMGAEPDQSLADLFAFMAFDLVMAMVVFTPEVFFG